MDQTASSPQAVGEAGGLPKLSSVLLSETEDQHHNTFQQKRHPAGTRWHEPHVSQELKRKGEQRDQTVNKARGSSLEEAAQQVREETEEKSSGRECPDQMQTDPAPFVEAPILNMEPSSETKGETSGKELY